MADEFRYWLLTDDTPTGPFTRAKIHAQLAAGTLTWQTRACRVGDSAWIPLVALPGVGPNGIPDPPIHERLPLPLPTLPLSPPPVIAPAPVAGNPIDMTPYLNAVPATPTQERPTERVRTKESWWPTIGTIGVVVAVVYALYCWLAPLSPRDVSERFMAARTATEAKPYAAASFQRAVDEVFRLPSEVDPGETFEWTADG